MNDCKRCITGRVTDAGGRPLGEARVSIIDSPLPMPDLAQVTGPDGRFAIGAPAAGRYVIGIDTDDRGRARRTVIVGDDDAALDVRLGR